MDFDVVRIFNIYKEARTGKDLSDYKVVFYHTDPHLNINISKTIKYGEIPDCFNCKVHSIDFDFDNKRIWIKSEVVKYDKK